MKKFVSWRRVSTTKQGRSGLGMSAQKDIINYFVEREEGEIIADYEEVYTGKDLEHCTQLRKAIKRAKKENAILIIAKTDRFRNVIEALSVYDEMGEGNILFCDLPNSDKFTLTIFFAIAEREALITSIRTKQALAQKKKQGFKLGNPKLSIPGYNKFASAASGKARSARAKSNANNIEFARLLKIHERYNGPLLHKDIGTFVSILNDAGAKTSTGLDFNEARAWSTFLSLKRQGVIA